MSTLEKMTNDSLYSLITTIFFLTTAFMSICFAYDILQALPNLFKNSSGAEFTIELRSFFIIGFNLLFFIIWLLFSVFRAFYLKRRISHSN